MEKKKADNIPPVYAREREKCASVISVSANKRTRDLRSIETTVK